MRTSAHNAGIFSTVRHSIAFLLAAIVLLAAPVRAEVIKQNSFQAASNGVNVTLHWITDDENTVARFEIERRSGTEGQFVSIGAVDAKGPSLYEFIDNTAFRKVTSLYQYRIVVYFANGSTQITGPITVTHTVSGVRRTWGSIKAMFR